MQSNTTCSLDDVRALNPDLGFAIYAYEPGGPVVLEIHTPDTKVFTFHGVTVSQVLATAFPDLAADPAVPDVGNPTSEPPATEEQDIFS